MQHGATIHMVTKHKVVEYKERVLQKQLRLETTTFFSVFGYASKTSILPLEKQHHRIVSRKRGQQTTESNLATSSLKINR